jgi:hypothetical protein
MLDSLPTRSREIILANMWQSVSLTLGILMSLHDLEDSAKIADQVVDMLGVDMSLG